MHTEIIRTPLGNLSVTAAGKMILACEWEHSSSDRADVKKRVLGNASILPKVEEVEDIAVVSKLKKEIMEYFDGQRKTFDIPIYFKGTPFQESVWKTLLHIPYGSTISYYELAEILGKPAAVRAVAAACRSNAISILIPCHRVIAKDGKLGGYAGGLDAKRFLLDLEKEVKE